MNPMKDRITKRLQEIESTHNIKILYACESGSRAWGFPSLDSDYDVRFVYIHAPEWYLSISDRRDVIEYPLADNLDINGWDLRKTLQLLRKSNPALLEWLNSPIVYHEVYPIVTALRGTALSHFTPQASLYHYLNLAKHNFKEYLQGETVWLKKYLYVLRPLIAMRYIQHHNQMPPTDFIETLDAIMHPNPISSAIKKLVDMKQQGHELGYNNRIPIISDFIESEFAYWNSITIPKRDDLPPTQGFDDFFRYCLKECWL